MMLGQSPHLIGGILWIQNPMRAVHCNLTQNGIDHQVCVEDMTSHLEEVSVDHGMDDDSPGFRNQSPGFHQRSPPQRSVSESELSRPGTVKLSKPVALWTQQDVCKWLKKHCPNQHQVYSDSFKQHDITVMVEGDLKSMPEHQREWPESTTPTNRERECVRNKKTNTCRAAACNSLSLEPPSPVAFIPLGLDQPD
ncbi:sterile alpha motif domain-containing protein 12-like isoform X3 [Myxocyprinus asiaticus]|uniref:sterile alpha motif domain-containing protein 12-like isoform X3 n=1 Tax=Myxocyprinus asiaticus TaxID=70543 RepID=UPI0022233E0B|nr:sterile alpha motif domain-containing protein 12-like isoform X3 [Myxocyprinus asiaticus]